MPCRTISQTDQSERTVVCEAAAITAVNAGNGLTSTASSGAVTLDVGAGAGIAMTQTLSHCNRRGVKAPKNVTDGRAVEDCDTLPF